MLDKLEDLKEINDDYSNGLKSLRNHVEFSGRSLGIWEDDLIDYYPELPDELDELDARDFYKYYKQIENGLEIIENNLYAATSIHLIIDTQMQQAYREKYLSFTDKLTVAHKELAARNSVSKLEEKRMIAEIIKSFWFEKKALFNAKKKQIESIFWLSKNNKDQNEELEED